MINILDELLVKPRPADMLAIGMFSVAVIYAITRGKAHTILAGLAVALILVGLMPRQLAVAFLVGASVILLLQVRGRYEGFDDAAPAAKKEDGEDEEAAAETEEVVAAAAAAEKPKTKEAFSSKPMLPDNRERREPLVLGKPYKLPSETDDKDYHLDAGTTFLNAYKALKPDQIAAMTKDTQDLLSTQRSLVSMLDSFAPLLKDMNKITGFFGPQN